MALSSLAGIWLPGSAVRLTVEPLRVALKGSYSVVRPVKFPARMAAVGTVPMKALGWLSFMLSQAKNQNSLLRVSMTLGIKKGPPAVTPYWLKWVTGRGEPARLRKKSLAVSVFGWLNSQAEPWRLLVPVLVIWSKVPPPEWPKAASVSETLTCTSCTASWGGL